MRIHGAQSASMRKKKSSAVLLFEAVADLWSAPDSPRERGDSQEGGNRRCLPSCAPARRQRTFRSLLKRRLYIIGIGEEKTLEISTQSTQYDIMEKAEISMPCKLMLARRSFFALRHRRGRKNSVQNQVRRVRLSVGVSAAELCGRSVLPFCISRTRLMRRNRRFRKDLLDNVRK